VARKRKPPRRFLVQLAERGTDDWEDTTLSVDDEQKVKDAVTYFNKTDRQRHYRYLDTHAAYAGKKSED
jgi:hypothetical protein